MVKHKPATPLPWTVEHGNHVIGGNQERSRVAVGSLSVAEYRVADQNAAYIAHAANAYPRLVEALRELAEASGRGIEACVNAEARAESLLRELGEL